ncbi:MAG TPA: hypothetical protein VNI84_19900 [Pyrinomonadaceae bacterium]|nr:hypothetical protein [Pyrinomonadaceae bacterium]
MAAIELNQAKIKVEALFQTAMLGEEVIITQDEKPVLKLVRVNQSVDANEETNALERLQKIRISAAPDLSTKANLYSIGNDDDE